MKKNLFFTLIFLILTSPAFSQVKLGIRGGFNLSQISLGDDLKAIISKENQVGFFVGPTIKVTSLLGSLGLDASALYNQTNSKLNDKTLKQQEIAIPINLRLGFGLGQKVGVFLKTGPQFSFSIGDKDFEISNLTHYEISSSNFSVNVGAGLILLNKMEVSATYNIPCGKTGSFFTLDGLKKNKRDNKSCFWQIGAAWYF